MPRRLIAQLALLMLAQTALPAQAQDDEEYQDADDAVYWTGGARFNVWLAQTWGNLRGDDDNTNVKGTKINFHDEFDIEQTSAGYAAEVYGGWDENRITLSYSRISFKGSDTVNTPFTFVGRTFLSGSNINTAIRYGEFNLLYEYSVIRSDEVVLSPLIGVEWLRIGTDVRDSTQKVSEDINLFTPVLGLRLNIDFYHMFSLEGEIHGMVLGINQFHGTLFNSTVRLNVEIIPRFKLFVGHHHQVLAIDADSGDVSIDGRLNVGGPIFGLEYEF